MKSINGCIKNKKEGKKCSLGKNYSNNILVPTYIIGIHYKAHKLTEVSLSVQSSKIDTV